MKVGDFVKVQYVQHIEYDGNNFNEYTCHWTSPMHGIILETPSSNEQKVWKMFCIERAAEHVLNPKIDKIEVISETNTCD